MLERMTPGTPGWQLYYMEHRQRYDFAAPYCHGQRVLDAACGVGFGSQILAEKGAAFVCGLDLSREAIRYASQHFAHPAVTYLVADALRADSFATPFDVVVSFETIEHVPDPERFVAAVHRLLAAEGRFLCSAPNIERHSRAGVANPFHLSEMPFAELHALLERYFVIEAMLHQSETPAYRRLLGSYFALQEQTHNLRRSRLLRFEERLRMLLGQPPLFQPLPVSMGSPLPGEIVLEPFERAEDWHKTYLFVGRKRL
jgi:2-polyprenyl-3-methyl-5-hydroxy-6-metoxy-1,4-benzoquinol methylase